MQKSAVLRFFILIFVIALAAVSFASPAFADNEAPGRTLPPLPTLPGRTHSPTQSPSAAEVSPTEAPVKLESAAGSDVNLLFIIGYLVVFSIPLIITLRNITKLKRIDRAVRRKRKKESSEED